MTTPTPAPTEEVNILLGTCHFLNAFFIIQLSVAASVYLLAIASAIMKNKKPTQGKVDYGGPWTLLNLMWSVSFWGIAPIVIFFIIFHEALPTSFAMASNMACINQGSFPAIPLLFGVAGFLFWVAYRPKSSCDLTAELIAREVASRVHWKQEQAKHHEEQQQQQPGTSITTGESQSSSLSSSSSLQVAFLGSSIRGMHYVRTVDLLLKKLRENSGRTSDDGLDGTQKKNGMEKEMLTPHVTLVDLGKQASFCETSANGIDLTEGGEGLVQKSMHFADMGPERPVKVMDTHSSPGDTGTDQKKKNPEERADHQEGSRLLNSLNSTILVSSLDDEQSNKGNLVPYKLPFASNSLDMVVIPPFFRKMPLFGGMTGGSPATVRNRSRGIMVEVYRVLKPGGTVFVVDTLDSTLFTLGDCREAGMDLLNSNYALTQSGMLAQHRSSSLLPRENTENEKLSVQQQNDYRCLVRPHEAVEKTLFFHRPWVFLRAKMFYGKAKKRERDFLSERGCVLREPGSPPIVTDRRIHEAQAAIQQALLLSAEDEKHQGVEELSWKTKMILVCSYQFVIWCLLAVLAAALYKPLDYPTSIVLGQRLGNLLSQLCTNYPMMAYFAREIFLTEGHCYSIGELLVATMKSDVLSILASLTLSVVFFFPSFGMQLALNDTTLSAGAKSGIGLAIAMLLGFISTYVHMKRKAKKEYLTNEVDPEAAAQLSKL